MWKSFSTKSKSVQTEPEESSNLPCTQNFFGSPGSSPSMWTGGGVASGSGGSRMMTLCSVHILGLMEGTLCPG